MMPCGMPSTSMADGRGWNGNATSEPSSSSGCHGTGLGERKVCARNSIGGMPTPPPMASTRGRAGSGLNGLPIGPSTLIASPRRRVASWRVPTPTALYSSSICPLCTVARRIDSGRRIGRSGPQRRCTNCPGRARAAMPGAVRRSR